MKTCGTQAESTMPAVSSWPPAPPPQSAPQCLRLGLFDLDEDAFHYVCSFVPIDDLLLHVASISREARRRVWANHALWQQLWMRYLLQFSASLIPPPRLSASATTSSTPYVPSWPVNAVDVSTMANVVPLSDKVWRLYHYHKSKESRPRVELLERLTISPESIADPPSAETPTAAHALGTTGVISGVAKVHEQILSFAQAHATRLAVNNLIHVDAASPSSSPAPITIDASSQSVASQLSHREKKAVVVKRRSERQAERLRRALRFLLSADASRPAFQDRLWTSTYEAGEAYRREVMKGAIDVERVARRRKAHAKARVLPDKDGLRPMSWLDDHESSVKVLLFDDYSRTVGDAGSVQAERIKLLAAIADHWRLAYAHQFYLEPSDGKDQGSAHPRPALLSRAPASSSGGAASHNSTQHDALQQQQQQQQDGRVSWEQIYRRFRDDNANVHSARIRESLQRIVVAGAAAAAAGRSENVMRGSVTAAAYASTLSSSRAPVTPSSGNPLFDMHLLTYNKRKQFYAAMLASTVKAPDGMGAFFATCVSEPFLRWWSWRSRQLTKLAAAGAAANEHHNPSFPLKAASSTAAASAAASSAYSSAPTTLWIARVCSVHKPQYGTTASDGSFGHRAPIEAAESIAYSSSYSDVTSSTDTLASDSSIDFVEEVPEEAEEDDGSRAPPRNAFGSVLNTEAGEGEEGVDAFQSYPDYVGEHDEVSSPAGPLHHSQSPHLSRTGAPRVALLFPLPHMLAYWFMMHHVTFYSHQVYRRMWGDQEITIAVCSRILGPAGHSVECRLFYTLRCAAFPRMYTKMMFTPGTLPLLTLQEKMSARSPYRSPSSSSTPSSAGDEEAPPPPPLSMHEVNERRDSDSDSSEEEAAVRLHAAGNNDGRLPSPPPPSSPQPRPSPTSSEPQRGKHTTRDDKPVDSRQVYDLFWTGFGRVEVESGPIISRSNLVRLRVALGLSADFPMGLLWNVLMFASGVGPLILKDHRHSLFFNCSKSFTDVVEEEFGEVSCYGYGARPTLSSTDRPMPNPLDAEAAMMRERRSVEEAAQALVDGIAEARNTSDGGEEGREGDAIASFSTAEPREDTAGEAPSSSSPSSSLTTSATTYGSWGLDSDFSSMGGRSSWRDWHTPYSDTL